MTPASTPTPLETRPSTPQLIAGRYQLLAKIASGGMATVYLARSTTGAGFGKLVALKCVHPHLADQPDYVKMFLDEARIASRVDHPNVGHVFDAGEDGGTYYLAMEYLRGVPLSELLKAWSLPPTPASAGLSADDRVAIAARIVADAAMGLHAAHELRGDDGERVGLVHRDISPQNLFLTYDGGVKVVDFGIAKAAGRLRETTTGALKGKLAYMSPEQLEARPIDRRSDVWALGVTLWELLTVRRLFKRNEELQTLQAVLDADVPAPSTFEPAVPPLLDRAVLRALERSPDKRPPTARAFADDLHAYLASRGTPVGMSQLADLMDATFTARRDEQESWVARASRPPMAPVLGGPSEGAGRREGTTETDPVQLPVRRIGAGTLFGIGAVVALLGVAVVFGMSGGQTVDEPDLHTRAEPVPAGPEAGSDEAGSEELAPDASGSEDSGSEDSGSDETGSEDSGHETIEPVAVEAHPSRPAVSGRRRGARSSSEVPPSTASAATPPTTGPARTVRIVHPGGGWAELRFDGVVIGRHTPAPIPDVAPGRHVVEVRAYGAGDWIRQVVQVPAGAGPYIVRVRLPEPQ